MNGLIVEPKHRPPLDPNFVPAELWNRAYEKWVDVDPKATPLVVVVTRPDGTVFRHDTLVLPHTGENVALNITYIERIVKLLLWMKGGSGIVIGGHPDIARAVSAIYMPGGARSFDCEIIGRRIFREPMTVSSCNLDRLFEENVATEPLGGHLEGCRIGLVLGETDRTCAAVIDGEVVYSEVVEWSPCSETDPRYHFDGIVDSIAHAAAHLPRIDAIGGGAAGIYVANEPRVGSLFHGISEDDFERDIRPLVKRIRDDLNSVPFAVVNDGEVMALAASLVFHRTGVLGMAMGSGLDAGYCDVEGRITAQLDELARVPVDYGLDAPPDEWSGDVGCGVQYFSQIAVSRLATAAGFEYAEDVSVADRLVEVQNLLEKGDERARAIFESIGVYLGYSAAWFSRWYAIELLLVLGSVASGVGGEIIVDTAVQVIQDEFPELVESLQVMTPAEAFEPHTQAFAAASLAEPGPAL